MSIEKVCGQRYLYTPQAKDGSRDWSLEQDLGRLESAAAGYWDSFANGKVDVSIYETRVQIAEFLAALHLRNKFFYDQFGKAIELRDKLFGGPKFTRRTTDREGVKPSPDLTCPGSIFAHATRDGIPKITKTIASYNWTFHHCDERCIDTSDIPITFFQRKSARRSGPGAKEPMVIFPISPKTLLAMDNTRNGASTAHVDADPGLVSDANEVIFTFAERFVILGSHPSEGLPKPEGTGRLEQPGFGE